ncbi:MAG TPA: M1 family aminopeptidase, partial [Gemmatimonadaceae bacterium]|nr:M1 family aminopeptidase [Gemmatimonadaceae bacterium]
MRIRTVILFCGFAHSALAQRTPPAENIDSITRFAQTQDADGRGYRLIHQDIALSHFVWGPDRGYPISPYPMNQFVDWTSGSFLGTVQNTVIVTALHLDSLVFDVGLSLRVTQVTDEHGTRLPFIVNRWPAMGKLIVRLRHAGVLHDTVHCLIHYRDVSDPESDGMIFIPDRGDMPRHPQEVWTEMRPAKEWLPTRVTLHTRITWTLSVTVPRQYRVVSTGTLVSDRPEVGGNHTVRWRMTQPALSDAVTFVAAPLVSVHTTAQVAGRAIPLDANVYPSDTLGARYALRQIQRGMRIYTRLTGIPFPWPRYTLVQVSQLLGNQGGQDHATLMQLNGILPTARDNRDHPVMTKRTLLHELAHEWFGADVAPATWGDIWLNEGFADFLTAQYWGAVQGKRAALDYLFFENEATARQTPDEVDALLHLGHGETKGTRSALVMYMLYQYLGPSRFWRAVHRYLSAHAFAAANTDDFREAIYQTTGQDMHWFFDEWVDRPGIPQFTIIAHYDTMGHRVTLGVTQTQDETKTSRDNVPMLEPRLTPSTLGSSTVPAVFHMPVTIRIGTQHGDVIAHATLNARTQTVVVDHVPSAPTMIVFDDHDGILKNLTFEQPTAWLVTMLARERTPWQTWWAIQQLHRRALKDSVARQALLTAVTHARYARTRAQAVTAVAFNMDPSFSAVSAAIDTALHDTSALVRLAVVQHPQWLDLPATDSLLQSVFAHDPSDLVRAE